MVIDDPPTHEASAFIHYGETRRRDRSVVRDLGLLKSNSALWRFGWRWWRIEDLHDLLQDLHDRSFMDVQPGSELFLKCSQLPRKLRCGAKGLAHFDESAHDANATDQADHSVNLLDRNRLFGFFRHNGGGGISRSQFVTLNA